MALNLIALVTAQTTLVLATAFALALCLRGASAGVRHFVFLTALLALALIPVFGAWSPIRVVVPGPAFLNAVRPPEPVLSTRGPGVNVARTDASRSAAGAALRASVQREPNDEGVVASRPGSPGMIRDSQGSPLRALRGGALRRAAVLSVVLWGLVASVLLLALARSSERARRIVRDATHIESPEWRTLLYEVADRLELASVPVLVRSENVAVPFACGLLAPVVVLPPASDRWSADLRTAVLLHELAHIRRRDLISQTIGRIVCAVYWFNPLVWLTSARLRYESELACDDLVLSSGVRPSDYAEHLLDLLAGVWHGAPPIVASTIARSQEFEGRVLAILDPGRSRRPVGRSRAVALGGALALVTLVTGSTRPVAQVAGLSADTVTHSANMAGDSAPAITALASLFRDPDPRVRESAVATAGHKVAARMIPQLGAVLAHDDVPHVRRMAAWALGQAESEATLGALTNALAHDPDDDVREMSAWALGWSDAVTEDAIVALGRAVRRDRSGRTRETAAWALARARDLPSATNVLNDATAGDPDSTVRATAAWALGFLRPRAATPGLVRALRDRSATVRLRAAWALGRIDDPASAPALLDAARADTDPATRAMLASVVEHRTPGNSTDAIIDRVMRGEPPVGASPWPQPRPRPLPWAGDATAQSQQR